MNGKRPSARTSWAGGLSGSRRDGLISTLAAASVAAHLLESTLPGFGPLFKLGLANVFTLVAFAVVGWSGAVAVSLIRVVAGALASGSFLGPTFLMSLAGALGALLALRLVSLAGERLGPVGASLAASLAHMLAQVVMAYLVVVGHVGVFGLLPWLLGMSWGTGILNGLLAERILATLARHREMLEAP
ncbi:MAG: Gx transporter family protein [Magnetococcales bacterium]|nr:Gx transporter family protein [Magnetococcales bacterium]